MDVRGFEASLHPTPRENSPPLPWPLPRELSRAELTPADVPVPVSPTGLEWCPRRLPTDQLADMVPVCVLGGRPF